MKRITLIIAVLLVVTALAALALITTDAGRNITVRLIEQIGSRAIVGKLEIDELRGNLLRRFEIRGLKVKEASGRLAVSVERAEVSWKLVKLFPPRAVIDLVRIERPDVRVHVEDGRVNLLELTKKKTDEAPSEKQSSILTLRNIEVNDGKIRLWENKKNHAAVALNGNVNFDQTLDRLPTSGALHAHGQYRGLPLDLKLETQMTRTLPAQALSAIAKQRDLLDRRASLKGNLGRSQIDLVAQGDWRASRSRWQDSRGEVRLVKLRYDANQIQSILPKAPAQDFEVRALAELSDHRLKTELEAHVETSAKTIIEAIWFVDDSKVRLNRFSVVGDCPLLSLRTPTELRFKENDPFPYARLKLDGCGGSLAYAKSQDGAITFDAVRFLPNKFLTAFSIPVSKSTLENDYGSVDLTVRLPKGLQVAQGDLKGSWDVPASTLMPAPTKLDFNAKVRSGRLAANFSTYIGAQEISADVNLAGLFSQGTWIPTIDQASGRVEANAKDFNLGLLPPALLQGQAFGGEVTAHVVVTGTKRKSQVEVEIQAEKIATGEQARRKQAGKISFALNGSYDSKKWLLSGQLNPPPHSTTPSPLKIEASGELAQSRLINQGFQAFKASKVEWIASAERFDFSPFMMGTTQLPQETTRLYATIKAQGEGTIDRPNAKATLRIETGEGQHADLNARFENNTVTANFSARDVVIDRIFPLFTEDVRTTQAILNADFNVIGRRGQLTYSGTASAKTKQLALPRLETQYQDIELVLRGDQREIELKQLSAKSGKGRLDVTGVLTLEKGREAEALRLNGKLDNFQLLSRPDSRIESTGSLTIVADSRDASFRGSFKVDEGVFTIPEKSGGEDLEPLDSLADVVHEAEKKKEEKENIFDRIHGTIDVSVPGQFWVKSDEINIELAADLQLGIDDESDFFMTGVVRTRRGYAEFFGRHFDVTRAIVEFQGNPTNPRLDAEAVYHSSPRDILVEVRGNLKDIEPRLSSQPAGYSEEEAIGVLLTGSPDYQSQGGGTSAGGVATGFLVGQLKQKLGAKLPFDVLTADIATDQDRQGDEARSRIEVGKYLTDKLFIKLGRTFASQIDEPVNRLTLDYRLSEKWSIETSQTDAGRSDIELQWTLNY